MTAPAFRRATPADFARLYRDVEDVTLDTRHMDEIYFLGAEAGSFQLRAPALARSLHNFAGVVTLSGAPDERERIARVLQRETDWTLTGLAGLLARIRSKRVLVLDFSDNLAGKHLALGLAREGVLVRDYLFAMHQLGQAHTYQSVREERDHVRANLAGFVALAKRFADEHSRATLLARLRTMLTLDRRPLLEVAFPGPAFINNSWPLAGLVVRDDDVFVDAGAAHGDTVAHFFHVTRGKYRAMHAFEPDSKNYAGLEIFARHLPNVHTHFAGLGAEEGHVDFYENTENRFGSKFGAGGSGTRTTMKIMTLDGAVDEASIVKVDVEGWEAQVLQGGAATIARCKPDLTISAYHYAQDIPKLLATVDEIAPYRNVALRHHSPVLYDTQLVFSDRQEFRQGS
jgi:FkbM family methyltransferase